MIEYSWVSGVVELKKRGDVQWAFVHKVRVFLKAERVLALIRRLFVVQLVSAFVVYRRCIDLDSIVRSGSGSKKLVLVFNTDVVVETVVAILKDRRRSIKAKTRNARAKRMWAQISNCK